jgi:hypothetical protein
LFKHKPLVLVFSVSNIATASILHHPSSKILPSALNIFVWYTFCTASHPVCQTNITSPGHWVEEGDNVQVGCSVNYSGNLAPFFHCLPPGQVVVNDVTSQHVTYRQSTPASRNISGTNFTCTTYINQSTSVPASTDVYTWTSQAVNVTCKLNVQPSFLI